MVKDEEGRRAGKAADEPVDPAEVAEPRRKSLDRALLSLVLRSPIPSSPTVPSLSNELAVAYVESARARFKLRSVACGC